MRSAAGGMLPPSLRVQGTARRSDRRKKQARRDKARKSTFRGAGSEEDVAEYRAAVWLDALEDVDQSMLYDDTEDGNDGGGGDDGEEAYDELEELNQQKKRSSRKRGSSGGRKGNTSNSGNSNSGSNSGGGGGGKSRPTKRKAKAGVLPKRFKLRSFASILLEEAGRDDGISHDYLRLEVRHSLEHPLPVRTFCPVTGLEGKYKDPKTGNIPYANLAALEQIRERLPPWMTLNGNATYHEAIKSLRGEH